MEAILLEPSPKRTSYVVVIFQAYRSGTQDESLSLCLGVQHIIKGMNEKEPRM